MADSLFATLETTLAAHSPLRRLEEGTLLSCGGVSAGAQPFLAVLLRRWFPERPIVLVADGLKTQETLLQDLETWGRVSSQWSVVSGQSATQEVANGKLGTAPELRTTDNGPLTPPPLFFPAWEVFPHEARLPHVDVISDRLETLVGLGNWTAGSGGPAPIVVAGVTALLQRTFPVERLRRQTRVVRRGDQLDPQELAAWLVDQGYAGEARVSQKGDFALRGGILDVFPPTAPWPVRLEFFGDDLDSLRSFDPITQISQASLAEVTLPPAGELGLLKRSLADGTATLIDHLPAGTILLLCEPAKLEEQAAAYASATPEGEPFFIPWKEVRALAAARGFAQLEVQEAEPEAISAEPSATGSLHLGLTSLEAFRPLVEKAAEPAVAEAQRREFFAQMHRWLRQDYAVHVVCNNEGERQRFAEIWEEYGFRPATRVQSPPPGDPRPWALDAGLFLHLGALSRGFLSAEARAVVVTDAEVFGRYKVQRPRRLKSPHAQLTRSLLEIDFTDLEDGDYVVHLEHGIGRYLGLQILAPGGGLKPLEKAVNQEGGQECLVIEYAPGDPAQPPPKLYVPVSEAHLVSKYVGAGKVRPPLNTLGGGRWAKAKQQAEQAVRDLASELLALQAARESQPGHAFSPDAPWQREFESAFLFEETPDQMRAIVQTKADMERAKPMDRLICGDVGFGKTEVAIRAAFKAVMGGKQVAVLVPTTILAQQHFNTFRERMADYPVRVELLSRYRSPRQQKRVIQDLAAGSVDIVIGTHRLIQSDVAFKELGLVVIDEEQRFGVLHKEKFKLLRRLVDVLTLSATPIPRTLHLALTGARDMSTIETPPQDRLPVETIVSQYDERLIRDAIERELNRQGQVYFLHNRVSTIDVVAQKLKALVPRARVVIGHGQMDADELEAVMTRFVNGEADVLLSTTIIESGLDIPNANTIIIDRADRFGLSDLYQLRGRVGRYKHQAYAYLLLPRHAGLLTDARKRISAIKQYSTLGSGFKIAMRDLEIRGAGNLLGAQQSGHITAVGFDLYCQLLKQSVASLKGEPVKPRVEVTVRLDFLAMNPAEEAGVVSGQWSVVSSGKGAGKSGALPRQATDHGRRTTDSAGAAAAYLPLGYVADTRQRIEIYRRIAEVTDLEAVERLRAELRDRFGPWPPPVDLLLQVAALKVLASSRGVTAIEVKDDKLMITRRNDYVMADGKFPRLTKTSATGRLNEIKRLLRMLR